MRLSEKLLSNILLDSECVSRWLRSELLLFWRSVLDFLVPSAFFHSQVLLLLIDFGCSRRWIALDLCFLRIFCMCCDNKSVSWACCMRFHCFSFITVSVSCLLCLGVSRICEFELARASVSLSQFPWAGLFSSAHLACRCVLVLL